MPYALQARVLSQLFFFSFLNSVYEGHEWVEDLSTGPLSKTEKKTSLEERKPLFHADFLLVLSGCNHVSGHFQCSLMLRWFPSYGGAIGVLK